MNSKKLIICEKPSVAMLFASALGVSGKHEGYIEDENWVITWAVGHLVCLSYPEAYDPDMAEWSLDTLPFLPKQYKYEVIKNVAKQFKIVKALLNRTDIVEILNGGDSAREGEYIMRLIFAMSGISGKKKINRVWIDSQTDEEIKRGIREARPSSEYDKLALAAYERAIEDYAIGINLSRALTLKFAYGMMNNLKIEYTSIDVGRVMTCVLAMICAREEEIRKFKPTNYYKIDAHHNGFSSHFKVYEESRYKDDPRMYSDSGFKDKKDAEALLSKLNSSPSLTVIDAVTKDEHKNAPLLYNLAELQSDCTKIFKISPDDTLKIAQSLYEKKLTTYPRTDARVITTAVSKVVKENIEGISEIYPEAVSAIIDSGRYKGIEKTKYVDDSKVSDHYAIIPTGQVAELTGLENDVYRLICRRFLSIFMPAATYKKMSVVLQHSSGERFYASTKYLTYSGFLSLYGMSEEDKVVDAQAAKSLSAIKKGDILDAGFEIITSTTQPPKRYTSGSMILAMENAGKLIEDEELREQIKGQGIGTSATRAAVITKLVQKKYIANDEKQILSPTKIGEYVIKIVSDCVPSMLSPKMTASWEKGLTQIENGIISPGKYRATLEKFVIDSVAIIKSKKGDGERPVIKKEVVGKCPACGNNLYESEKSFICSKYRKDDKKACKFGFSKVMAGFTLSDEDINALVRGGQTQVHNFTKKSGGSFEALLKMSKDHGKIIFEFPTEETELACPKCGCAMKKGTYMYECGCGFKTWHTISGKKIAEYDMQDLFESLITGPFDGFETMDKKPFSAYLLFDGDHVMLGKELMSGRNMERSDYEQLLEEGSTDELKGFKSSKGNDFSAKLKIDKGRIVFDLPERSSGKSKFSRQKRRKAS